MESQSLRKRQTILVEKRAKRTTQAFSSRNKRLSGTHQRTSSRQFSASTSATVTPNTTLDGVAEEPADSELFPEYTEANFDADKFLVKSLAGASLADVKSYEDRLQQHIQGVSEKEAASLRNSYETMRAVAEALSELAPQVGELRRQVGELHDVSEAMRQDAMAATSAPAGTGRRSRSLSQDLSSPLVDELVGVDRRQSMIMLNQAWAQDLGRLFQRVEGAQKYLPAAPGRHVVAESSGWHELNLITWQPVKGCTLFLLSDHLLVATPRPQLVVDECWSLADIRVDCVDKTLRVRSSSGNIHAYRSPSSTQMNRFLDDVAKTRDKLQALEVAQTHAKEQQQESSRTSIHALHRRQTSTNSGHMSVETKRGAMRVLADIDLELAHRNWSNVVDLVTHNVDHPLVGEQVVKRQHDLVAALLDRIKDEERLTKSQRVDTMRLLIKLNEGAAARKTFLNAAAEAITKRTQDVHFMGDVVSYISQMAAIYFQNIRAAVETYRTVFPAKGDSSAVVAWAKSQVDLYAAVFERQLYRIPTRSRSYRQCVEVSRRESSQLKGLAMDMDFMLRYVWVSKQN